ncbi:MAG: metallophosphoesterase protein [Rhodospirillales bacterium]|nr:metallophosphoesterase protein [Rhodospirillales bacterium]
MTITIAIGEWQHALVELPENEAVIAIGDIHGQLDLMVELESAITRLHRESGLAGQLVRLGDYIDRGPHGIKVLERIQSGLGINGLEEINLAGNHDHMLLAMLPGRYRRSGVESMWIRSGGHDTLLELGFIDGEVITPDAILARMPLAALGALTNLRGHHVAGNLMLVHAGLSPVSPPSLFLAEDWRDYDYGSDHHPMWIRSPFLDYRGEFEGGLIVVHGHTPTKEPGLHNGNRIALDTGAYGTGILTAAELRLGRYRLIQATDRTEDQANDE